MSNLEGYDPLGKAGSGLLKINKENIETRVTVSPMFKALTPIKYERRIGKDKYIKIKE